ncbi:MAG: SURF1 family protein [Actinomycetota bacterium]
MLTGDWSFAKRPFWIFSHVFAVSVVSLFLVLGVWQLSRHQERGEQNEIVGARAEPPAASVESVLDDELAPAEIQYRYVAAEGQYVDPDAFRIANRSQGGSAGQHVVALFELTDGRLMAVNRGFVALAVADEPLEPVGAGVVQLTGWLQPSVEQGWLGATDTGEGNVLPRFDLAAIEQRLGEPVVPVWIQAEGAGSETSGPVAFPDPVPLPPLDAGPHLSYAGQWFIFAVLGVGFYLALLRRTARQGSSTDVVEANASAMDGSGSR